jgi:hypothetical protein
MMPAARPEPNLVRARKRYAMAFITLAIIIAVLAAAPVSLFAARPSTLEPFVQRGAIGIIAHSGLK